VPPAQPPPHATVTSRVVHGGATVQPLARASCPRARSPVPARAALARTTFKFSLFSFKFSSIYVLRRATIYFQFRFISVLRRALRRVTIHFNFRLFNVLRRAFRRMTIYFKFSLSGACRRVLCRAKLYVIFIFNSSVSWRVSSRDDSF
jgi:hypothetical protein